MRHHWKAVHFPHKSDDGQQLVSSELWTIFGLHYSEDKEQDNSQTYQQNQADTDALAKRQSQEVGVRCCLLPRQIVRVWDSSYEKNLKADRKVPLEESKLGSWSANRPAFLSSWLAWQWKTFAKVNERNHDDSRPQSVRPGLLGQICMRRRHKCNYAQDGCRWRRRDLLFRLFHHASPLFYLRWHLEKPHYEPTCEQGPQKEISVCAKQG